MEKIKKEINVENHIGLVFQKFIKHINDWWPKEYTWSKDKLMELKIDAKKDGLCSEIGPHGFRCDWGRVVEITKDQYIQLKWQISPNRVPTPDPKSSSDIKIEFYESKQSYTKISFTHYNFEHHGEGAGNYRDVMNGKEGWDFILNSFKNYCER